MKRLILALFFAAMLISLHAQIQWRNDSNGWRGPARNGIFPETGLLKSWPDAGPELLWETLDAGK